jgi:hypothetical protein
MTTKHLSELEIQQYALEKASCGTTVIDHIQACRACRLKAEAYQHIFEGIKEQPKPNFDFNLADLVMDQLPQPKQRTSFDNIVLFITAFFSILVTGFAIYFFRSFLSTTLTEIAPILVYLIITTLATLLIVLGIDMFARYNRQMKILDFN